MTFFSTTTHVSSILVIVLLGYIGLWPITLICLLCYVAAAALFRKNRLEADNVLYDISVNNFVSPVNGKVVSIEDGSSHVIIHILVSWFDEFGIRSPAKGEVVSLERRNNSILSFRYFHKQITSSELDVVLEGNFNDSRIIIGFKRCLLGLLPIMRVIPGDRPMTGAEIGIFPFGGSVLLYLPKESKILLKNKQMVVAGTTVVASKQHS